MSNMSPDCLRPPESVVATLRTVERSVVGAAVGAPSTIGDTGDSDGLATGADVTGADVIGADVTGADVAAGASHVTSPLLAASAAALSPSVSSKASSPSV